MEQLEDEGNNLKCPCQNCITYILCKDRLNSIHDGQVTYLSDTCPYLKQFLCYVRYGGKETPVDVSRKVFGLQQVPYKKLEI